MDDLFIPHTSIIYIFPQIKNTVWSSINAEHDNSVIDYASLEEQFAMVPSTSGTASKGSSSGSLQAPSQIAHLKRAPVVTLLAMQRSNNIGILLANLKMPPAQVCAKSVIDEVPCQAPLTSKQADDKAGENCPRTKI